MATIFGNVRLERGQFRHLMASRVIDVIARAQGTPAMPTRIGDQINSHVHAPGWDSGRVWPGCPGCPPGFRRLFVRRPRARWRPASPSEDGGFDVVVEFC